MNRAKPYLNRLVKIKQQQIQDMCHSRKLQQMKPVTYKHKQHSQITMNHGKKQMIREEREIQIEKDNQFLLQKIAKVMTKKPQYSSIKLKKAKVNKSLNEIYRKHQLEDIQQQNHRFLHKLQNKRPSLNIQQWQREWQTNRSACKRLANVGFHTSNIKSNIRIRSIKNKFTIVKYKKMKLDKQMTINGHNFQVKIEFNQEILNIVCQLKDSQIIKIIEIPKEEAIIFIEKQCNGNLQNLAQKLRYDPEAQVIQIVSLCLQEADNQQFVFNPETNDFISGFQIESKSAQKMQGQPIAPQKNNQSFIETEILQKRVNVNTEREIQNVKEQPGYNHDETERDNQQNEDKQDKNCPVFEQKQKQKSQEFVQNSIFIGCHKQINSPQTQIVFKSHEVNKQIIIEPSSLQVYNQYQSESEYQKEEIIEIQEIKD